MRRRTRFGEKVTMLARVSEIRGVATWPTDERNHEKEVEEEAPAVAESIDEEGAPEDTEEVTDCRSLTDGDLPTSRDLIIADGRDVFTVLFLEGWETPLRTE